MDFKTTFTRQLLTQKVWTSTTNNLTTYSDNELIYTLIIRLN